ncbi:MAG: hypothetical protein JO320_23865 [Alphaproteobacteria bacterium]|nr:hypothetical protein [Alphaproteobacteria bacterium]MBV9378044.1 hypothetical protein [Alphaproteobacteria bacterium]
MTLFQVEELTSYWAEHPPLHLLIAAYLGAGRARRPQMPPGSFEREQQPRPDAGSVLAGLGSGFSAGDVHAGLTSVVLDFAELYRRSAFIDETS